MIEHKTRRILGIDPGSHRLGVGCIEKTGNQMKLIFAEVIVGTKTKDFYSRLQMIGARLTELLDDLKPHEIAIEDAFFAKNARSAMQLGITRGIAVSPCLTRGLQVFEYAPTQVKSVVTGDGRADKTQVQKMVGLTLGMRIEMGFDATDAIAVAICHASSLRIVQAK